MPQPNGTGDGHGKPQADHLPAALTDERAPTRLSSRDMNRYPDGSADELDLDALLEPALCKLATNLVGD